MTRQTLTTYTLTDSNATETYESLDDAKSAAEDWYQYMLEQREGEPSQELRDAIYGADFDGCEDVIDLNNAISDLEAKIAAACGAKDFSGHGTYHVRAADQIGLALVCRAAPVIPDDDEVQDYIDRHSTRSQSGDRWLPDSSSTDEGMRAALIARLGDTSPSGYMSESSGWSLDDDDVSPELRTDSEDEE